MVIKLIIYKINRLQERALRLIYNDHISSLKELLSKDDTFTTHKQNIQNLAIDLATPDFSELFQLNESLYGLRSNGPQKLCIPNIYSVRFGIYIKVPFNTLVQSSEILYQQKLKMLRLCHLLRKTFEHGKHQIVNVNFE